MSAHEVLLVAYVDFTDQKNTDQKYRKTVISHYMTIISQITVALGLL